MKKIKEKMAMLEAQNEVLQSIAGRIEDMMLYTLNKPEEDAAEWEKDQYEMRVLKIEALKKIAENICK